MAKLSSFTFISLNGFYKGLQEDISWHQHGSEEAAYSAESLQAGNTLLFGRVTYEMMKGFWPTEMARESFPEVAEGMNKSLKLVASKTLKSTDWNNTRILSKNLIEEIRQLKKESKNDITLLGSGQLLTQLADANLIDTYQFMIDPVVIGSGKQLFSGLAQQLEFELMQQKTFKSGVMLVSYKAKK